MRKLMIADDEAIVRQGIIQGIGWEERGYRFIAEASDGKEAYAKISECRPDVLLLDIRMPVMDGLALMKLLHAEYPDIGIIILSSYAEFEYAKQALRYGADEYLLKLSAMPEDICRLVDEVYEKKQKEIRARKTIPHYQKEYLESFQRTECYILAFRLFRTGGRSYDVTEQVEDILYRNRTRLFDGRQHMIMSREENRYVVILDSGLLDSAHACADRICRALEREGMLVCRAGAAGPYCGTEELERGVWEAEAACADTFFSENRISLYNNIRPAVRGRTAGTAAIQEAAQEESAAHITDLLRRLMEENRHIGREEFDGIMVDFLFTVSGAQTKCGRQVPEVLRSVEGIWRYVREFYSAGRFREETEKLLSVLYEVSPDGYAGLRTIVRRIQTAVEQNYSMELSLRVFSELMNISYSYLSVIFKNETGYNFKEYLNLVRINKAKELFRERGVSVGEAAELTGYSNQFYFSKIFKRYTGVLPIEYKRRCSPENGNGDITKR